MKRHAKRIATDAAGYVLLVLAVLTGWLPGPGGIPLALAGLGLLSINNEWARRLRDYLLNHGGKVVRFLFPKNRLVQWLYDLLVVVLLVLDGWLLRGDNPLWQISVAAAAFLGAVLLALMNRDRLTMLKRHHAK